MIQFKTPRKRIQIAVIVYCFAFYLCVQLYLSSSLQQHEIKAGRATVTANTEFAPRSNPVEEEGYDIVTLVHHDDMDVFFDYGLESWQRYFLPPTGGARIYAICTPRAYEKLEPLAQQYNNFILVHESIYPFTLADIGNHTWGTKYSWIYQQVLKLYSYRVLAHFYPPVKPLFLVVDSDTVAVRPYRFTTAQGLPVYNIASSATGAFNNDCVISKPLLNEIFLGSVEEAYPEHNEVLFSAITHHMMFNGTILNEMLDRIERLHGKKETWKVVSKLKRSALSEWELYMGYLLTEHRDTFVIRRASYANWGLVNNETLSYLKEKTDIVYVTDHDDYQADNLCCVNAYWGPVNGTKKHPMKWRQPDFTCMGCQPVSSVFTIDCNALGLEGCYEEEDGSLRFRQPNATSPPREKKS